MRMVFLQCLIMLVGCITLEAFSTTQQQNIDMIMSGIGGRRRRRNRLQPSKPPPLLLSSSTPQKLETTTPPTTTTMLRYDADPMSYAESSIKSGGCPFLDKSVNIGTYDVPSLFNENDNRPIVLFDGNCNLCTKAVQFLLKNDSCRKDPRGNLRFAALQSQVGNLLCRRMSDDIRKEVLSEESNNNNNNSNDKEKYKSIAVCTATNTYIRSGAALMIGRALGGWMKPLRYLSFLGYGIPTKARDRIYNFISKRRHKWFGTATECLLYDERFDTRFVDDGILTNTFRNPFADPNQQQQPATTDMPPPTSLFDGESPPVKGDKVRIVWPVGSTQDPSITYLDSHMNGICLIGGIGTIATVDLPMRIVLKIDKDSIGLDCIDGEDKIIYASVKPVEVDRLNN